MRDTLIKARLVNVGDDIFTGTGFETVRRATLIADHADVVVLATDRGRYTFDADALVETGSF